MDKEPKSEVAIVVECPNNRNKYKQLNIHSHCHIHYNNDTLHLLNCTQYHGNVLIYQINVRENHEVWISNLCAQTSQPIQTITPLFILSPPTALNAQYTHDPNYQNNPTTLAFTRNNTVALYNNTSQQNTTQLNLRSNSQITQHNIQQNRIIPRNNNSLIK